MGASSTLPNEGRRPVLLADDEPEVRGFLETALRYQGFTVESVEDGDEALECIHRNHGKFSVVFLDVLMPRKSGLDALREIRRFDGETPVILLSCAPYPHTVVEAMKSGATDFLGKPVTQDQLRDAVARALQKSALSEAAADRHSVDSQAQAYLPLTGLQPTLSRIGASNVPVLVQGETGVGKEVVARLIHSCSSRSHRPFVKLNCAALPSELVESELFGYERGAFTGAFQRRAGMFEFADGGTLLLDEIGDMPYRLQAKLLQVLQDSEFQRVGGRELIRVNVRLLAATHCDLVSAIRTNRFREDLYYRLNVFTIRIPPLRERKQDIIPLSEFLLRKHAEGGPVPNLSQELKEALVAYSWPGNVRELENVLRRLTVLQDTEQIIRELQKFTLKAAAPLQSEDISRTVHTPKARISVLEHVNEAKRAAETDAVLSALNATHWNRKRAATLLNIDYKALLYKIKKLGIESHESHVGVCDEP